MENDMFAHDEAHHMIYGFDSDGSVISDGAIAEYDDEMYGYYNGDCLPTAAELEEDTLHLTAFDLVEMYAEFFATKSSDKDFRVRLEISAEQTLDKVRRRQSKQAMKLNEIRWHFETLRWLALNVRNAEKYGVRTLIVEVLRRWLVHGLEHSEDMYDVLELLSQNVEGKPMPCLSIEVLAPMFAAMEEDNFGLAKLFAPLTKENVRALPALELEVPAESWKKTRRGTRGGRRAKNML
jgi:hypothetical protein